jgi:paraquat-inducible protein B
MNRPAAWRVGVFVLLGTALLVAALMWVSRDWFTGSERVRMRFEGSVWGLQPGAPVVLRGVRVGQVREIGLDGSGAAGVPVLADLDRAALAPLLPDAGDGAVAPRLVQRGLVASLATQSLLTGLLYVDLELDPALAAAAGSATPAARGAPDAPTDIPTRRAALAALQRQLSQLDVAQIGSDLQALAGAARRLVAQPEAEQALVRAARAAAALEALAQQLQKDWPPLARSATGVLDASRSALREVAPAAAQAARDVSAAASAADGAARGIGGLTGEGRAALVSLRQAGDELARAAQQLGSLTATDGAMAQDAQRALADVSRAARSLRELADLLERHPDALLRGREETPR